MTHLKLSTPRLRLRAPCAADVAAWTAILREPAVSRYWHSYDPARVRSELLEATDKTVLTIESAESAEPADSENGAGPPGQVLGAIQYCEQLEPDYRQAGVDLFLTTRCHGRGLGSEAIHAVLGHLINTLRHHRITIDPAADNQRAISAYERAGFRRVGLLRQYERGPDGTFHDGLLLELLASDYRPPSPRRSVLPAPAAPACALRPATAADLPLLVAMMTRFNQHEGIPWDAEGGAAPLRRLLAEPELGQITLFCQPETSTPIGYAVVTYGFDLEFGGRDAFLTEMYLEPAARGQGIGQSALAQLLDRTREAGVAALHLQVRADNPAAQRLYRAAGFVGTTRVFMSRDLASPVLPMKK